MQVVHGENDLVANDPLVEYPPFCVIYPAHDLIPFPGRDNVVGQDHVRLFLRPFLPYLIDERLRLLPIIHVERVELPPSVASDTFVCLGNSSTFPVAAIIRTIFSVFSALLTCMQVSP